MQVKDYLGKRVIPKGLNYVCVIAGVPKTQRGPTQDSVVMVEFPCYLPGYTHQCTFTVNETHYLIDRIKNISPLDRPEIYRYISLGNLVVLEN